MAGSNEPAESGRIDRRTAIKKGIATGTAAGLVWSAPRVEGLTLRPNYAAAGSVAAGLQFNLGMASESSGACGDGFFGINGRVSSSQIMGDFGYLGGASGTVETINATGGGVGQWNAVMPSDAASTYILTPISGDVSSSGTIEVDVQYNCC